MTKTDLIDAMQNKLSCSKKDADNIVNSFIATMVEAMASGEKITIAGFGTFEVRERNEKLCKNPRTGEVIVVPATKAPAFKPSKNLKKIVNEK